MDDHEVLTLEERIEALETDTHQGQDFDSASWFWLVTLGVLIPCTLLIIGWWL